MTASASRISARWVAAAILVGVPAVIAVRIAAPAIAAPSPAPAPTLAPRRVPVALHPAPVPAAHPALAPVVWAPPAAVAAAAPAPLVIRRVLDTGGPIRYGSYFWDEAAVPAGPLTITVDLKAGVLSVFRDGYEIGTAAVIYGADHKPTPLGVFPILQKDRHHFSSVYHHAPMPYTLRLTDDGVSIHASKIAADYATHGCIGVPTAFARRLFDEVRVGDRVIVTNQGMRTDMDQPRKVVG